jgi:sec-independent protein translocase protein TatA
MQNMAQIALLFDVSGGEFLIILLFILIFFGSKNIPDLARGLGRGYRQLKDATNNIKREIQAGANDITGDVKDQVKRPLDQHFEDIKGDIDKNMKDIDKEMDDELNK